jgi:hypothetical protein
MLPFGIAFLDMNVFHWCIGGDHDSVERLRLYRCAMMSMFPWGRHDVARATGT